MSGQLPSRTGVYDNAAEFGSDIPTFAHHLRRAGYRTCLSGKMHFVGPDQLHGFEERLTTDIYPADFGWTPDYAHPDRRIDWWYHNLGSVTGAGTAEITNQLEYDDEVAHHADREALRPRPPPRRAAVVPDRQLHPSARPLRRAAPPLGPLRRLPGARPRGAADRVRARRTRIRSACCVACDHAGFDLRPEDVRRARRGYFAGISYVDEKIGGLLDLLGPLGFADDTVVVLLSDHGDMLGERGLWFKMSFREGSARVPLMIAAPGLPPGRVADPVSTLDVLPTLAELCGIDLGEIAPWCDGESLVGLARGDGTRGPVPMEYAAEGSRAPMVALRDGRWKLVLCDADPPQLFDLAADPHELRNLADDPGHAAVRRSPRRARRGALGSGPVRRRGAGEPGAAAPRLCGAAQRRLLPLGLPAAAARLRALHAQPHEPRHPRGRAALPAGRALIPACLPGRDRLSRWRAACPRLRGQP